MTNDIDEMIDLERGVVPAPYEMEQYDRSSLDEIKRMIVNEQYDDANVVQEHISFLERLSSRLTVILNEERSNGLPSLDLRKNIEEINNLRNVLSTLRNKFSNAS